MKHLIAILVFVFALNVTFGQASYDDAKREVVESQLPDSVKVDKLIDLCKEHLGSNELEEAMKMANQAKEIAQKASYLDGLATAYKFAGIVYYYKGDYLNTLEQWQLSYDLFDSTDNKEGMANILNNIGAVYFDQGENAKALEKYQESLRISEEVGVKIRIATAMMNIGAVYFEKKETHKLALEYYLPALQISEEIEDTEAIGTACVNIGEIYLAAGEDVKALEYFEKSLVALNGGKGTPYTLVDIGKVYEFRGDFKKAKEYHEMAFEIAEQTDATLDASRSLVALAGTENLLGNFRVAINNYKKARIFANKVGANKELKDVYGGLALNFSAINRFDSAFKYQTLYSDIKDTLFNIETAEKLKGLMFNFELEKKEGQISQLTTENQLRDDINKRQDTIIKLVIAGLISVLIFLYIAVKQKRSIEKEKQRSDELLLNILPYEVAEELKEKGESDAKNYTEVTVLFTDFKSFTNLAQLLSAKDLVKEINLYFKAFDGIITKYGIEKIKTIGDAYMAAGGLPIADESAPKKVVLAAIEMQEFVSQRKKESGDPNSLLFDMRAGIHTGSVVAGIVGVKKFQYDIWGDTVNTASRMESNCELARINISEFTYAKIKNEPEFEFEARGMQEVKGKGMMQMYFVSLKK